MSEDRRDDPDGPPAEADGRHDRNGEADPPVSPLDLAKQRAKIADLRRWCQHFLDDPAAAGVLPDAVVAELRAVEPAVSEPDAMALYEALGRGVPVRPDHPAFRPGPGEPPRPRDAFAALTAERERLRQAFFAVHDAVFPDTWPSEEELLRQMQNPCTASISDMLAEFERLYPE